MQCCNISRWKPESHKLTIFFVAVGLFYIPGCYQQDHSAAALVPLDFMRKITGYEKYSEHIHAVNWGVEGHQNLRMLLRQMQRWGLLPAKYSPSLLHSSPSEKECPKVFDLRKPKYKPRTGVHAVTTLVPSAMRHSLTLQPLFAYLLQPALLHMRVCLCILDTCGSWQLFASCGQVIRCLAKVSQMCS